MEVIRIEQLSKLYRLGEVGSGTLSHDINRWWAKVRGKEDPFAKIGMLNDRTTKGNGNEYIWAIKDIDFSIGQGEVLGVIGKNGAGKSTLLKIISQITAPTKGNIKIKGRIASLLEVGTGFHAEMTGRENIFLNGTLLGMSKREIQGKMDEIVDFAGVSLYLDTPVKRYSSGMLVRLGFAVAAFLEPEILIVDEVLAVGDAEFQKKALGRMKDVSKNDGRTVLFVSHNMGAIRDLCQNGIYLKNGRLHSLGEASEMVKLYLEDSESLANSVPLHLRKDRKGTNKVVLKDFRMYDFKSKKRLEHLITGDDILVEIQYESQDSTLTHLKNAVFGCAVHTKDQQFITPFNNQMSGNLFRSLPASGSVFCYIPRFPLMYGEFTLHLGMTLNNELVDYVENAFMFKVESGDFFRSGTPNSNRRQGVYLNQVWAANVSQISLR